ncbi:MAG TPA: MMPL family transporter [Candidatus Saccharimonas sp.]|nr:MMPL family transporter [Candidatus Saccharimonas sp.]
MFGRLFRAVYYRADELLVVAAVIIGAALYYAPSVMDHLSSTGFVPNGAESTQVRDAINTTFSKDKPTLIVLAEGDADVDSTAFKTAITDVEKQIKQASPNVTNVQDFYSTQQQALLAKDGKGTLVLVSINGDIAQQQTVSAHIRDAVKSNLRLSFAGEAILNHDITAQINSDLSRAEIVSFAILAVLLIIVFRGVVAAVLPLILGGFSVLVAFLVLRGLVEFTTVVEYALNVIVLIGLGLAVDYSLLMVSRFREELVAQKGDIAEALRITMQSAGRTIFFSGLTVIISLLALTVFPLDFLRSMGLGGAAAVLVAMGGALIVLPSLLRVLGHRVNWLSFGHVKAMHKAARAGEVIAEKNSIWRKTGAFFMHWAIPTLVVVLVVLLGAGSPFLRAHLATPDYTVLPADSPVRISTEKLQHDFAFSDSPIQIVYTTDYPGVETPAALAELHDYTTAVSNVPGITSVTLASKPIGKSIVLDARFDDTAMSADAQNLVKAVRDQTAPQASVKVGGATAELVDLLATLTKYIPYALAIIAIALFVLLFFMLGSLVLPLVAMVQNVLSLAASFGMLVLIFQDGHLAQLLHTNASGAIDATQPVLIFAVAFGLSMDYSLFLYGRIKEEHDHGADPRAAVLGGLQKTGGIITSAAVLLFVVVVAFASSQISIMQQIGVGLALAILVDAFLVRMVMVPATMRLLGRAAWWAPKLLKRLQARVGLSD